MGGPVPHPTRPSVSVPAQTGRSDRVSRHDSVDAHPRRCGLLWLNGPFGVGKSTVARLVSGRLGATVFEPGGIGSALARLAPDGRLSDLDDSLPLWRSTVVHVACELAHCGNPLVILPATVYRAEHVDEMIGALRAGGTDVLHVVLIAQRSELAARIHHGPFDDATKQSYFRHLTSALSALSSVTGALSIDTTLRPAVDVAAAVVRAHQRWWGWQRPTP
jgi:hypothetical protein